MTESPPTVTTRRTLLHGTWALPALWLLARRTRLPAAGALDGDGDGDGGEAEDVAAFLSAWTERAAAFVEQDRPNEDAHLHALCEHLARLDPAGFPPRKLDAYQGEGLVSGPVFFEGAFLVVEFELEPGGVIRPHNHVGYDFVSMGVEGELDVRHYEPEGVGPDPGRDLHVDFAVREVSGGVLRPGRTSTLTRTRANIHGFQAGERGARMLDFGIHFPDPGDGPASFSVLEIDPEPLDAARRTHTARYIGNIFAEQDED